MTGHNLRPELRPPSLREWVWWLPLAASSSTCSPK
ncbi:hypothetical protein ABIE67_008951 [Streptomyces sp. V4I8]